MPEHILYALALTTLAGLCTGVGGFIAVFGRPHKPRFLSTALGFSAGVMIYISFVELMGESVSILSEFKGGQWGFILANLAFFTGIALIAFIDYLVPKHENPHEMSHEDQGNPLHAGNQTALKRMGLMSALAIAIHNFPEGMATFVSTLQNPDLGLAIAIAIGIHNIPEGIAIAVPIYYATGSRAKAFCYSLLSGLAEPLGGLIALVFVSFYWNDMTLGLLLGAVAGIMVFISLDLLLPGAERYGKHHHAVYGLVAGMAVMAFTLVWL